MQVNDLTAERLRRLAGIRAGDAKVLSLFVNLDPREFATPAARRTEVRSLLDRAARRVRDDDALGHAERASLRADLERLGAELGRGGLDAKGAHGLAIFAASAVDLFEVLKLPEPVEHDPVLADGPFIEPLSAIGTPERWCALLVNRRIARLFCGAGAALEEIEHIDRRRARAPRPGRLVAAQLPALDRQGRRRSPAPRGPARLRASSRTTCPRGSWSGRPPRRSAPSRPTCTRTCATASPAGWTSTSSTRAPTT